MRREYDAWYRDMEREAMQAGAHVEVVSAFYTRLASTVMKIAILLELSHSRQLTVSSAALAEAIELVDYLRATIRHLLQVEFIPTENGRKLQRVEAVVAKKPGVNRKVLLQTTGYLAKELAPLLETLKERGSVYEQENGFWPT